MYLKEAVTHLLEQIQGTIGQLSAEQYTTPISILSNASIGQHVRHIIEFYLELDKGYNFGVINYDKRNRDHVIETNKYCAIKNLDEIKKGLSKPDKNLLLSLELSDTEDAHIDVVTNYFRELMYNLEHTVHHMAIIRIGITSVSDMLLPVNFGVAGSTIKFRNSCAQ